ncbi:hypothetical protein S83_058139, partial [Arachis hypogaea]
VLCSIYFMDVVNVKKMKMNISLYRQGNSYFGEGKCGKMLTAAQPIDEALACMVKPAQYIFERNKRMKQRSECRNQSLHLKFPVKCEL